MTKATETEYITIVEHGQRGDGKAFNVRLKQKGSSSQVVVIGTSENDERFSVMISVDGGIPMITYMDRDDGVLSSRLAVRAWWQ